MHVQFFASILNNYLPEPHASLLNGIIFGIPLRTTPRFYEELRHVGLLHLVVLSGSNIAILAALVGTVTRYIPLKLSLIVTSLVIVLFVLFVGPEPPIVRAGIMGILAYFAVGTGYRNTAWISLGVSCILIAVFAPQWLATLSFQLSCAATLGIMLFGARNRQCSSFLFGLRDELQTSVAAQVFTTPLIFFVFQEISFIAPLSNIAVSFLITPLMICGFAAAALGSVHYALGYPFALICQALLSYMIFVVSLLNRVPFSFVYF